MLAWITKSIRARARCLFGRYERGTAIYKSAAEAAVAEALYRRLPLSAARTKRQQRRRRRQRQRRLR